MKVLIVDDDVVSRMMLMHMVDAAGGPGRHEILEAEDGEEAWTQLAAGARPALLFCDLRMPRLSGMELLARTKADPRFAELPFVLVSAAADSATMEQALALGAAGYIVKPFDSAQVRAHLERVAGSGARDEEPDATLRRLGIDAERLLAYLGGLLRQLGGAGAELGRMLAAGQTDAAGIHLKRLAEGCRMLGLLDSGATLEARASQPGGAALASELEAACAAVLRRTEATRQLAHS